MSDHFWWAEGVVAQDRFYCTSNGEGVVSEMKLLPFVVVAGIALTVVV